MTVFELDFLRAIRRMLSDGRVSYMATVNLRVKQYPTTTTYMCIVEADEVGRNMHDGTKL